MCWAASLGLTWFMITLFITLRATIKYFAITILCSFLFKMFWKIMRYVHKNDDDG